VVLARVRSGPPTPLRQCNPAVSAELAAICDKAMARDPAQRYPDTLAFAEDLRAWLEHRVVAAYETGPVAELRKWIGRNRALAAASAAAAVILAAASVVSSSLYVLARQETVRADARADDVLSLSAAQDLQDLVARADVLWPARAESVADYETWLRDARALIEGQVSDPGRGVRARPGLTEHRRKLAELEARALPAGTPPDGARGGDRPALRFAESDDRWWHAQLTALVRDLEAFADPATGLCSRGTDKEHGWGVERRLEFARTIAERSVTGTEAAARWRAAIAAIADPARCPRYDGLRIEPQIGLLPIGCDPQSGLWEFAHLPTGRPAERGPGGAVVLREGDGLVLVLIPGGSFWMGAQSQDPAWQNYDALSHANESPVHEVTLAPWFLSKYEMTQDQWARAAGSNPSHYGPGTTFIGDHTKVVNGLHPVEQVTWRLATTTLQRLGLVLPTEAQWEFAARAGSDTAWWTGTDKESLRGAANLADAFARDHGGPSGWHYEDWLDDGYQAHAPVGTYRANGNGLFDVAGNLHELCRDARGTYPDPVSAGDGERQVIEPRAYMIRGGSYLSAAHRGRSAVRLDVAPDYLDPGIGLRPAMAIGR
jgi:formylglycine-generating enzyme required for sulfatase activity